MDIELARTFLEIVATGNFVRAAERLNVAQTTVSARVRTLEEKLGRPIFVRNKAGASLTPAGEQFLRYAPTFVQLWQRVQNVVAVPEGHESVLTVAAETSLWQPLLMDWVVAMRRTLPELALRAHVDVPWDLVDQVADGLVDAAVMYAPPHRPGLKIDLLLEEKLVLVTSNPKVRTVNDPGYLTVDWGPEFAREFDANFPDTATSGLSFDFGPLALGYLLSAGGIGYFRMQAVAPYVASGQLHLVTEAPRFSYPIYAVSSTDGDETLLVPALAALRGVVSSERD